MYTMSDFSEVTGLPAHTLRYYESLGLLHPERSKSGRRSYSDADLAWIQFVLRLRATGMPIKQIVRYSQLREAGDSTMPERLAMLEEYRGTLSAKIDLLCVERENLDKKIAFYREQIREQEAGPSQS